MSTLKQLGTTPIALPEYTWQVIHNVAREASVSPMSIVANLIASLASQPALLQDVLDSSEFYQRKLKESANV